MQTNSKPSILAAAAFPVIARSPKELTEDWITTLDMEKSEPWMPAGRPMRMILLRAFPSKRIRLKSSRTASFRLTRSRTTSTEASTCESAVARPTPFTPMPRQITKKMFIATFRTPAMVK